MADLAGIAIPDINVTGFFSSTWVYVVLVAFIGLILIVVVSLLLYFRTFNRKVIFFENISGLGYQPVMRKRARRLKVGTGGSSGGGGGSPNNIVATFGEVTSDMAYKMEGGKTFTVSPSTTKTQTVTIPKEVLQSAQSSRVKDFSQGTRENYNVKKTNQEIYSSSYITRKEPTISGYTKSGKPIYEKGKAVVVNPFEKGTPEYYKQGSFKERSATKEEESLIPSNSPMMEYNPEDYFSYKELFRQNNLPGVVRRVGYNVGGFATNLIVVPYKKFTGYQIPQYVTSKSRTILGETVLFAGFSPAFKLRTDIVKEIYPFKNYVKVTGVQQTIEKNMIKTDVAYKTTVGKSGTIFGIKTKPPVSYGVSTTYTKFSTGGSQQFASQIYGSKVSKAIEFPTGKILTKLTEKYKGYEIGVSKGSALNDNVYFSTQKGFGGVGKYSSKKISPNFIEKSYGFSFKGLPKKTTQVFIAKDGTTFYGKNLPPFKKFTIIYGKTLTGKDTILTKGLIKEIPDKIPKNVNFISKPLSKSFITPKGKTALQFPTGKLISPPVRTIILEDVIPSTVPFEIL